MVASNTVVLDSIIRCMSEQFVGNRGIDLIKFAALHHIVSAMHHVFKDNGQSALIFEKSVERAGAQTTPSCMSSVTTGDT